MAREAWGLMSGGLMLLAALSSSPTYQLNSYGLGSGGTHNASSSTYTAQGNVGEQASGTASGSTYTSKNGAVNAEQLAVPPAPTLSNGSGTYYNKLSIIIQTGSNPNDTTFAVAASPNAFGTTYYLQADGTLGVSAVYQTYSAWGGASGTYMTGLSDSTTYQAKVAAKQGMFTNTAYGPVASSATTAPSISFAVSPNTTTLSSLLPGSIITSADITLSFTTNAAAGGSVYVAGQNNGLASSHDGHTISAYGGDLSIASEGFGLQIASATQTSGGPFGAVSPYSGTGTTIGAEALAPRQLVTSSSPIVGGSAVTKLKAKAAAATPAAADYQEVLTFVAAASF